MPKRLVLLSAVAFSALMVTATLGGPVTAKERTVTVGGAAMYPSKNIVENAVNSKDHTTLVAAVKAAGLVNTLSGPGPFTVFAPTNAAFGKLPKGTVATLVKPENKATLAKILTYHVEAFLGWLGLGFTGFAIIWFLAANIAGALDGYRAGRSRRQRSARMDR